MAYCRLIPGTCTVTTSVVPLYGGDVFVAGVQAGMQYPIQNFVALFPNSGFVVPPYCQVPQQPGQFPWAGGGQTQPPAASSPPPPPPPASGPPTETPVKPITGEPEQPPAIGCGPAMARPAIDPGDYEGRYGHSHEDGLKMPAVGQFVAIGLYAGESSGQGDTVVDAERPLYTQKPLIEYDNQGRIKTYHLGTGPGYYMFGPVELQPWQFYGDNTNHSPRPGAVLPKYISKTGLAVLSFQRNNTGHGDSPDGWLGLGVPHPTGYYPADGWVDYLSGSAGSRQLNIRPTDYDGVLTSGKNVKIWGNLELTGLLTAGATIDAEESISTPTTDLGTFSAIDIGSEGGYFEYVVVGWNNTDGESMAAEGCLYVERGALGGTLRSTLSHPGAVTVSVAASNVTITVQNTRTASDNTCWTLHYRKLLRSTC